MNKLLRLALALFIWFNVLYADENDIKLTAVIEYKYNPKGELSDRYIYDGDEILRTRESYYYDKGRLTKHYNFTNGRDSRLFAYEYSNGKLIKMYEAEWTTHKPVESAESLMIEYEYNRYGNLVYQYRFIGNDLRYKIKYEYENGKIIRSQSDAYCVCVYDSEQNLVESKVYRREDVDLMFDAKYHYDENRLSHTITRIIWGESKEISGKTKYEYDLKGRLIRTFAYGAGAGAGVAIAGCIVNARWHTFFKLVTESIHSKKTKIP